MTVPTPAEWPAVLALLRASRLPTSDLSEGHRERFLVARRDGDVVGCVAVEPYGGAGLLRSLAVAPEARGTGLGRRLTAAAEAAARAAGLAQLILLTTTAAPFFESLGWAPVDRADVPEAIRASTEFAGLCPASAACLGKVLSPTGIGAPGTGSGR
ncbi:arsenic resistance N-acetyltransferase ArsN2 [Rubrivirga sp. IMCC43871]|uniref:arsenic resistance N-acetyltransferase ArsN2 n=1 Tax=Rubrivirga sp. IMCC43871 TaxID=3391575 RepID=UPI003990165D